MNAFIASKASSNFSFPDFSLAIIMAFNCVQAFITADPPPYLASATPSRMNINPSKWFWELDH